MSDTCKVVFFDVKNVLAYFDLSKMHRQIAEYCQIKEELVKEILEKTGWGDSYEKGLIDSRTLFHHLPPEIQGKKGFVSWFEAIANTLEPDDSLNPLLKKLKKNGIKLFIFSNICEAHFSYAYTHFPTFHLFDDYILSYEIKTRKPEEAAYKKALEKTYTEKKDALFIEGSQEWVEKARSLGLESEFYTNHQSLKNDLEKRGILPS